MDYEKMYERLFKTKDVDGIDGKILQTGRSYLSAMFNDRTLTYEKLVIFINKYKKELIESALNDDSLINNLLYENMVIDTTKRNLITKEYLEDLINKINNKEFEPKVITFYLYIMQIYNLLGNKYDEKALIEILNLNIVSILNNQQLSSKDGDTILTFDKKIELMDKFLAWNRKCGKKILPYILRFETLKENITTLINSDQVRNNMNYQNELVNLLKICEYSIIVRDTDITPAKEEVELINNMFNTYKLINNSIILDTIDKGDIMLVHFVRDNDVDYQLVGNDIIDVSGKTNNEFDSDQSEFFISSYFEQVRSSIEKQTGKKFDINNPEMRRMLEEQLVHYNRIINNRPLDRLPIKKREASNDYRIYLRETDGRLSCSFVQKQNSKPITHLNRKIGLIVRPAKESIISTSLGYSSEKTFYDFIFDSIPCTEIFSTLGTKNLVNETCVDASKCEVIGVLLLSDEKDIVERAERIAASYNTKVIRQVPEKNDMQTIKH